MTVHAALRKKRQKVIRLLNSFLEIIKYRAEVKRWEFINHLPPQDVPIEEPHHLLKIRGHKILIYGGDYQDYRLIRCALNVMTLETIKSLTMFSIMRNKESCDQHLATDKKIDAAAHCHPDTRTICFDYEYLRKSLIWHEAAHARTFNLPDEIITEWKRIAKNSYKKSNYDGKSFPRDGIITVYGAKDALEDIAIWVEYTYAYIAGIYMDFNGITKKDKRYMQKLKFLLKWKFITKRCFNKITPLLK